jgi:hypothetical protein
MHGSYRLPNVPGEFGKAACLSPTTSRPDREAETNRDLWPVGNSPNNSTGQPSRPVGFTLRYGAPDRGTPTAARPSFPSWKEASFFQVVWRLPKSWRGFALQMPRIVVSCGMSRSGWRDLLQLCEILGRSRWAASFLSLPRNTVDNS